MNKLRQHIKKIMRKSWNYVNKKLDKEKNSTKIEYANGNSGKKVKYQNVGNILNNYFFNVEKSLNTKKIQENY